MGGLVLSEYIAERLSKRLIASCTSLSTTIVVPNVLNEYIFATYRAFSLGTGVFCTELTSELLAELDECQMLEAGRH